MKLIELHILQSFPVTCLNRNDLGSPKSANFGGVNRARVSSQCLKRAQRKIFKQFVPEYAQGVRTRLLVKALYDMLLQDAPELLEGHSELPKTLAEAWGKLSDTKGDASVESAQISALAFYSPAELKAMVKAACQFFQKNPHAKIENDSKKKKNKEKDNFLKKVKAAVSSAAPKDAADIALFGRMVANDPSLNVEGAAMFSHALSTHRCEVDFDYFTAMDDLQPEDQAGAGMIGMLEFNSACYYRYIAINVDLLKTNLRGLDGQELKGIVSAFIRSALLAVPKARKNTMNGSTLPGYVLGLAREGQPLQLVNAFEKPVKSVEGYLEKSKDALKQELDNLSNAWDIDIPVRAEIPGENITSFIDHLASAAL